MTVIIVVALGMAIAYDSNQNIRKFLMHYYIGINLFLVVSWAIPLGNGIWLIMKAIQDDGKECEDYTKNVSGFYCKP